MLAFVHGPDALLVREAVRVLAAERDPSGENTSRIDGRSTPASKIAIMAGTPGFFGAGRVLIVDDLFAGKSRGKRAAAVEEEDESGEPTGSAKEGLTVIAAASPDNLVIFAEPALSSVPAAVKKAAPGMLVRPCAPTRGRDLLAWIRARATQAGSSIDERTAALLATTLCPVTWQNPPSNPRYDVPPDLDQFQQEIEKLAAYAHPDPIAERHVREMTATATADALFPFTEALFSGDAARAVVLLRDVLDRGDDLFRVFAQVMQQVELAAPLEAGLAAGRAPEQVGVDLAVGNPKRMLPIAKASRANPATPLVAVATAADRDQKQGRLGGPEDAMEAIMIAAARRPTKRGG